MQLRQIQTMHTKLCLVVAVVMCLAIVRADTQQNASLSTTLLNAALCPTSSDPWGCSKIEMGNMLDIVESELDVSKQLIKDEADAELEQRIQRREFSESEVPKEKPSTVMTTMDNYVRNSLDSFVNHKKSEEKKMKKKKKPTSSVQFVQVEQIEHEVNDDDDDDDDHNPTQQHAHGHQHGGHLNNGHQVYQQHSVGGHQHGGLFGPPHFKKKHGRDIGEDEKAGKQMRPPQPVSQQFLRFLQRCRQIFSLNECRRIYNAIQHRVRGRKKKKVKKTVMKLLLIAAVLKAKLEFLLKILATHLQIKFFIVALLGLGVNCARFWFDLKKGHNPQKVIYYEHAQHQHHYDEHDDSGGYWKRSFDMQEAGDSDIDTGAADDLRFSSSNDPQRIAYRDQLRK